MLTAVVMFSIVEGDLQRVFQTSGGSHKVVIECVGLGVLEIRD
jgi:hypothetical protein